MKLQYVVLLGLIIFNVMLITTSVFFPATTYEKGAVDVVNSTNFSAYRNLNNPGQLVGVIFNNIESMAAMSLFTAIGLIGTVVSRNIVPLIACAGIGMFTSLYMGLIKAVYGITSHPIITTIIILVGICIGVIIMIDAIEAMKGRAEI